MRFLNLIYRSIIYYRKPHLMVALGAAICTMVIAGALIVGDSVRHSLEKTTILRLGKTEYLFSGNERYFRAALASEVGNDLGVTVSPVLQLNGTGSSQGGTYRLNNLQVLGIDQNFLSLVPEKEHWEIPENNQACISENVANRLQIDAGDALLLRVEKASQIPKNAPFVSIGDNQVSIRLIVKKILTPEELGRYNLKASQTAPFNIFVSLSFLNQQMEMGLKANKLLIGHSDGIGIHEVRSSVRKHWKPVDMALEVLPVSEGKQFEIRSERVFIDEFVTEIVKREIPESEEIITYLVNTFRKGDLETPYSFMAAGPFTDDPQANGNSIIINSWMADDLKAVVGDSIGISYFVMGPLRQLKEEKRWFVVSQIVEMEDRFADPTLMPDLPGLSDADNCREWDTGVPIDLDKIRDKDEEYWNKYRGTPKAFSSYKTGKLLWENRFGVSTAIRIPADNTSIGEIEEILHEFISPESRGFTYSSVRTEGLSAARGGVDFGQLFMALSFFLLVAGLVLMSLLFNLHLEKRTSETGTFKALGFTHTQIKNMMLGEGLMIAVPGVAMGIVLAIVYNKLIFYALNTFWQDIVRTNILEEVILYPTLITGAGISLLLAITTLWISLSKQLKLESRQLQSNQQAKESHRKARWQKPAAILLGMIATGLLVFELIFGSNLNTGIFFTSGGLLLITFLISFNIYLKSEHERNRFDISPWMMVEKNLSRNPARSMRIVVLFALGTFIIISTGLNKKDLYKDADLPGSGTGGFLFFMETTIPVLNNLNDPEVKTELGIGLPNRFIQMRKGDGDDASCLNLNRVTSPRILGIPSGELEGRFSFLKSTNDLDRSAPWASLKNELPGGVVPAVLDQTVIQWGLGKKVGDTLVYLNEAGEEMQLKIVGGLANSIFQGHALIDEDLFLKHFPSGSGTQVFLVDGNPENIVETRTELEMAFRNDGMNLELAAERLAMFNEVENTYLSIFLILGGLAMILGTVGLGISLARNIQDRGYEISILQATGIQKNYIFQIISTEHMILLLAGTFTGAIAAFIATIPSVLSEFVQASWQTAVFIITIILINGWLWIRGITRNHLKKNLIANLRKE